MRRRSMSVLFAVLFAAAPLTAASFAITPGAGTLGYGGSFEVRTSIVGMRLLANTGHYSRQFQKQSIEYDGTLKLNNAGAIVDLYPIPLASGFHASAGVFSNRNRVDLASVPSQTIIVNGVAYPASLIGSITGDVRVNKNSPYAGIGWSRLGKGFGLVFDLGALYHGSPKLSVQPHPANPALVPASFYTNLEAERVKTQNDIRNYKYHPVAMIGLSFAF